MKWNQAMMAGPWQYFLMVRLPYRIPPRWKARPAGHIGRWWSLGKGFVWFVNTNNEIGKFKPIRNWPSTVRTSTTSFTTYLCGCWQYFDKHTDLPFSSAEMQVKNVPLYDRHTLHSTLYSERWAGKSHYNCLEFFISLKKMEMIK